MQTDLNDTTDQWRKERAAVTFVGPHQSVEATGEKVHVASVSGSVFFHWTAAAQACVLHQRCIRTMVHNNPQNGPRNLTGCIYGNNNLFTIFSETTHVHREGWKPSAKDAEFRAITAPVF